MHKSEAYSDIPGTYLFDKKACAPGLPTEQVLHVADEGRKPPKLSGR